MRSVVLIGAGNVAWSLARAIAMLEDYELKQIYARNITKAQEIASLLDGDVTVTDDLSSLYQADIYVLALKDDAIAEVVERLPRHEALWLHTSGGVTIDTLNPLKGERGVLYPLQTFSRGRTIDFKDVPLFVEGSSRGALDDIVTFAGELSDTVVIADSHKRRLLHVAAVFACNFTNHLWAIASDILERGGMEFGLLQPLIYETIAKALDTGPATGQTGPARRGDFSVMDSHAAVLDDERYRHLYRLLSQSIFEKYKM